MWTLYVLVAGLVALLQLLDDVGFTGGGQERRQPVVVLDDLVGHHPGLDLAGPADHLGNPERALPVGVLLAAERRGAAVGPAVAVRPVVGAVDDDGVLGDAEFVEAVEQLTDVAVVVDHRVVVARLPKPGLPDGSPAWCGCSRCMWVMFIHTKNGVPALCWRLM